MRYATISSCLLLVASATATSHVPLKRRDHKEMTAADFQRMRSHLTGKYGAAKSIPGSRRRPRQTSTTSTISLTNHNLDSSYSASMDIGTPPKTFSVILDTGSSDLWLASTACTACSDMPLWNTAQSTSFQGSTSPISIKYGSGDASGTIATDVASMGAFTVPSQKLAVIDTLDADLAVDGVSGLMGLGFQSIAATGALPWWQALVQGGVWSQPLMSFYFTRFLNNAHAEAVENGGVFTMGGTNTSFYTGDVDFVNLPQGARGGYWLLPVQTIEVNGQTQKINGATKGVLGAIDTGTTLIGAPENAVNAFYAAIPGSTPGTGNWEGFMLYPCNTQVNMQFNFGSKTWPVSDADFRVKDLGTGMCAGAVFALFTGDGPAPGQGPQWVIGDSFLKNVYTVFRFDPPSVGFAVLASAGNGQGNLVADSNAAARGARVAPVLLGALLAVVAWVL